ncbi:MAG: hypothetical protein ACYCT2_05005 [Thermoplasmataceae archaeon]
MNRKTFLFLAIFTATLLPATATAAVIINDPILVSTSQNNAVVYITDGPGYSQANSMGFLYADYAASGENVTLDLNYTHHGSVNITNALEIVNDAGFTAQVWLNGTLPAFVTMYYSTSQAITSSYGTEIVSGSPISVSSHSILYVTIVMNTLVTQGAPGTATITMQYAPA